MRFFTVLFGIFVGLSSGYAIAQSCAVLAPPTPPVPFQLVVALPSDGGTQGCTITAYVRGSSLQNQYPVSNGKCATAVAMAQQAAANDNGWNDGGAP